MSKKIKTLVQKYEKDMQFENRFDELKHKLDLIPDAEIKSEVYTIKKKVMPAYAMMLVLLMLITGIVGLQFGLNTSYVEIPEVQDLVELKLTEMTDLFEREAVEIVLIEDDARINIYIGIKDNKKVLIISGKSKFNADSILVKHDGQETTISKGSNYVLIEITDESNVVLEFQVINNNVLRNSANITLDLTLNYLYLGHLS